MICIKVAIVGAGIAGLSCAHEFERYGVSPVIYERNSFIGDPESHVSALLDITNRPVRDSIAYVSKNYHINLTPLNPIKKLIHYSPNEKFVANGHFGYLIKRSHQQDSLKSQIYSQLKGTQIVLSEVADYRNLENQYDYVILATGNTNYTNELGCWQTWVRGYVRAAVVLGSFDPTEVIMWIHTSYCKNGYAYLTPFNDKKASIVLFVPNVTEKEIDFYWNLFLYTENLKYNIVEEFKEEHKSGYAYPKNTGNIYFIGNSGGAIDPFLGFGQLASIEMGALCAKAIMEGKSYEKLLSKSMKRNKSLFEFRDSFDKLTNKGYDNLMRGLNIPLVKPLVYSTNINVVKYGSAILKWSSKDRNK